MHTSRNFFTSQSSVHTVNMVTAGTVMSYSLFECSETILGKSTTHSS